MASKRLPRIINVNDMVMTTMGVGVVESTPRPQNFYMYGVRIVSGPHKNVPGCRWSLADFEILFRIEQEQLAAVKALYL